MDWSYRAIKIIEMWPSIKRHFYVCLSFDGICFVSNDATISPKPPQQLRAGERHLSVADKHQT